MSHASMPSALNGTTLLTPVSHDFRVWPAFISGPSMSHALSSCLRATAVRTKRLEVANSSRRSRFVRLMCVGAVYTHGFFVLSIGVALERPVLPSSIAIVTRAAIAHVEPPTQNNRRRNRGDESRLFTVVRT